MRRVVLCMVVYLFVALSYKVASADEGNRFSSEALTENYISGLYKRIDFSKCSRLSYDAFDKAMHGYLNLKNAGKLNPEKNIISICDFTLSSTANRLWTIDLSTGKVLYNTYVAHGQGSGDEYATSFSNRANSHQSSLGFYVTADTYEGEHGNSLHLQGLDEGFNNAAFDRDIVIHAADYVSSRFINAQQRLGRSWGCPAINPQLAQPIINTIKDGTCLFIYYPDRNYLSSGYWLNKKIASLPGDFYPGISIDMPKTKTIEYIHNGKVDSVRAVVMK